MWRDRLLLSSASCSFGRIWWRLAERIALPGITSHWMRRKREIDRLARQASDEGFNQLIVLGAGLDTLAFRCQEERLFDQIVSADHPTTLATIRAAMISGEPPAEVQADHELTHGVELVDLDLTRDELHSILAASRLFNPSQPTFVVVEGVFMYFPPSIVTQLFRTIAALPNPVVRLVASAMVHEPGQDIGFRHQSRLIGRWLASSSEPMLWATRRSRLPVLLAENGWDKARLVDLSTSDIEGDASACGLESELLFVAERSR